MSESSELTKKLSAITTAPKIDIWYRVGAIVLGLVGLAGGGAAVFLTHVEAGPVALIVVGFLFILIGVSGRLPNRLKIGDNEAEWYSLLLHVQETTEAAARSAVKSELEHAFKRLEGASPEIVTAMANLAFHFFAQSMLQEVVARLEGVQDYPHKLANEVHYVLHGPNGKRAYHEVIAEPGNDKESSKFLERKARIAPLLADIGVDRFLYITNGDLPRKLRAAIMNDPLIETISISDEADLPKLLETITSVLELPEAPAIIR
jgi:hypothetical protein